LREEVSRSDEAAGPALTPGTVFRLFTAQSGVLQTGIAIANPAPSTVNVQLELLDLSGASTGNTTTVSIPASGHLARFLPQLPGFASLPASFQGMLRVSTDSALGVSTVGVRGQYNSRADFLVSTLFALPDTPNSASDLIIPDLRMAADTQHSSCCSEQPKDRQAQYVSSTRMVNPSM
jgi:hypothetical protein